MTRAVAGLIGAVVTGLVITTASVVYVLTEAEQVDNFSDHETGHERHSTTER